MTATFGGIGGVSHFGVPFVLYYYPKVSFVKQESSFIIKRVK
ncbi:MAG TPA: hypothetical protein PK228_18625 [Saprospiraceae bacterium]|nr:hypothetical protein [Saprospiraceae bacterium]